LGGNCSDCRFNEELEGFESVWCFDFLDEYEGFRLPEDEFEALSLFFICEGGFFVKRFPLTLSSMAYKHVVSRGSGGGKCDRLEVKSGSGQVRLGRLCR